MSGGGEVVDRTDTVPAIVTALTTSGHWVTQSTVRGGGVVFLHWFIDKNIKHNAESPDRPGIHLSLVRLSLTSGNQCWRVGIGVH